MRIAEEQNRPIRLEAPVCIVDDVFPRREADLVKILPAIHPCDPALRAGFKDIEASKFEGGVEGGEGAGGFLSHHAKLILSNIMDGAIQMCLT